MYYFSKTLDDDRLLCLAPLTSRLLLAADTQISDPSGYFLYEQSGRDDEMCVRIIAQVHSDDAALSLREMMQLD